MPQCLCPAVPSFFATTAHIDCSCWLGDRRLLARKTWVWLALLVGVSASSDVGRGRGGDASPSYCRSTGFQRTLQLGWRSCLNVWSVRLETRILQPISLVRGPRYNRPRSSWTSASSGARYLAAGSTGSNVTGHCSECGPWRTFFAATNRSPPRTLRRSMLELVFASRLVTSVHSAVTRRIGDSRFIGTARTGAGCQLR